MIRALAPLEDAGPHDISFLSNPKYQQQLANSQAGCVIVAPALQAQAMERGHCIVADNPYLYFAKLTQLWRARTSGSAAVRGPGDWVHPSAVVHPDALVHPSARIGALCVIERGARIGAMTELRSRVTVGGLRGRAALPDSPGRRHRRRRFWFCTRRPALGKNRATRRCADRQ